ncbi:MAG TPA: phosphoribosylamine--glycine ligase [Candidatus Alistipes faecavium]|nr:phosphoribosylamine--glycine ligase [Candidatus Alistipes faecavium]
MNVLVIGSGGREHAIVDALARSPQVEKIICAPGNAGIARQAECVPIRETEVERLRDLARERGVALTVVGPEAALAAGIVDCFKAAGLRIFGPTKAAARIESSKEFAKNLMARYGIPTAAYRSFTDYKAARDYVAARPFPAVLKYDGLAAGKGVVIAQTMEEADRALRDMLLDDKFGEGKVVVEDFLTGPEFSLLCFVSGSRVWPMVLSQDHKRAFDGDKGPNTGGMGAYSPLPFITAEDERFAVERIMRPTAEAMVAEGCPFEGVLYGGLMKTPEGIKVIEFNARFGDPETEVVLPRLKSDIAEIFCAVADGGDARLEWDDRPALGIVLASKGYPGSYGKGHEIKGLDRVEGTVYHMGTKADGDRILTAGGRVLFVVGRGATLAEAREAALRDVARIECDNLFHRTDIGHWALDK